MISIFSDLLRCVMVIYPTGALVLLECQSLFVRTFCDIVKLRSRFRFRSRSGEGQEAKSRAKSSSEDSKLKDLDLSHTMTLVFPHPGHPQGLSKLSYKLSSFL